MGGKEVILHVENDPDDAFMLKRAFSKAGAPQEIRLAENGQRAVSYLNGGDDFSNREAHPLPAIILLDWNMPLMSGSEFLKWLRAESKWKHLPVLVLTSSAAQKDMQQAYELGANGFLVKPHSSDQFIAMAQSVATFWLTWNCSEFGRARLA